MNLSLALPSLLILAALVASAPASAYTVSLANGNVVVTVDQYEAPPSYTGDGVNGSIEVKPASLRLDYLTACVARYDGLQFCEVVIERGPEAADGRVLILVVGGCTPSYCAVGPVLALDSDGAGDDYVILDIVVVDLPDSPGGLRLCNQVILAGPQATIDTTCVRPFVDAETLCASGEITRGRTTAPPYVSSLTVTGCASGVICQAGYGTALSPRTCVSVGLAETGAGTCVRVTVEDGATTIPLDVACVQDRVAPPPGTLP